VDTGDTAAKDRANHTGTQLAATISDFNAAVAASAALAANSTADRARSNHTGTQLAATISDFDTQVRTNRLDQMAAPTAAVALNGQKITGMADPTAAQDASTKAYTDARAGNTAVLDGVPVGTIVPYGGATAPTDWMLCQGQSLDRITYADLFAAISTAYGSVDSTHFNLPNLQGRVPIGAGTGTGDGISGSGTVTGGTTLSARSVGAWGGSENHSLTVAQMPSHNHGGATGTANTGGQSANHYHTPSTDGASSLIATNYGGRGYGQWVASGGGWGWEASTGYVSNDHTHAVPALSISSQGGSASHPNVQPFVVTNYIIKVSKRAAQGLLAAVEAAPVGTVVPYAGAASPNADWLLCDGSAVSRTTYADLFAIVGTTYGAGDTLTTFNLPDMRGRVPVGAGTGVGEGATGTGKPVGGAGLTARTRGEWGGEQNHTLTTTEAAQKAVTTNSENATHQHGPGTNYAADQGSVWAYVTNSTYGAALIYLNSALSGSQTANHQHTITGSNAGTGHNTMQPFVVTNYIIRATSVTPTKYGLVGDMSPIGSVTAFAGATLPADWLLCDGSSLLRTDYPELFTVLGTTWGSADATHFNLPDLRGRTLIGTGTGAGVSTGVGGTGLPSGSALTARTLAQWGGEQTHTVTVAEMPSHIHTGADVGNYIPGVMINAGGNQYGVTCATAAGSTAAAGGGGAHNTMPPWAAVNYIIKAKQTVATTATGNSSKSRVSFTADGVLKTFTLRHTLSLASNEPYIAQIWEADASGNPTRQAIADVVYSDFQNVNVVFGTAPANGKKYILTVIG